VGAEDASERLVCGRNSEDRGSSAVEEGWEMTTERERQRKDCRRTEDLLDARLRLLAGLALSHRIE
jgi:hypothetical protein